MARREHHDADADRLAELDAATAMIAKAEATIERLWAQLRSLVAVGASGASASGPPRRSSPRSESPRRKR